MDLNGLIVDYNADICIESCLTLLNLRVLLWLARRLVIPCHQVLRIFVYSNKLWLIPVSLYIANFSLRVGIIALPGLSIVHDFSPGIFDHLLSQFLFVFVLRVELRFLAQLTILLLQDLICSSVLACCHFFGLLNFLTFCLIGFLVICLNSTSFNLEILSELLNLLDKVFTFTAFRSASTARL